MEESWWFLGHQVWPTVYILEGKEHGTLAQHLGLYTYKAVSITPTHSQLCPFATFAEARCFHVQPAFRCSHLHGPWPPAPPAEVQAILSSKWGDAWLIPSIALSGERRVMVDDGWCVFRKRKDVLPPILWRCFVDDQPWKLGTHRWLVILRSLDIYRFSSVLAPGSLYLLRIELGEYHQLKCSKSRDSFQCLTSDRAGLGLGKRWLEYGLSKIGDTQTMANGEKNCQWIMRFWGTVVHHMYYTEAKQKKRVYTSNRGGVDHEVRFPFSNTSSSTIVGLFGYGGSRILGQTHMVYRCLQVNSHRCLTWSEKNKSRVIRPSNQVIYLNIYFYI